MRTLTVIAGTTLALALGFGAPPALAGAPVGAGSGVDAVMAARNQAINVARTLAGHGVADPSITNRFGSVAVAADGHIAGAASAHGVEDPAITDRFVGAPVAADG